ncbi:hypothetical protein HZS_7197, partial [Henneguya salminicola]
MADANFFNKQAENCVNLCNTNPNGVHNYHDVSKIFTESFCIFLENLSKKCHDILVHYKNSKNNFDDSTRNLYYSQCLTENVVERNARFRIGSICSQVNGDTYVHYAYKKDRPYYTCQHRLSLKTKELSVLSNGNKLCESKTRKNLNKLCYDEINPKEHAQPFICSGISNCNLRSKVIIFGKASSFWSSIDPTVLSTKPLYVLRDCSFESGRLNDIENNINDIKNFSQNCALSITALNEHLDSDKVEKLPEKSNAFFKTEFSPKDNYSTSSSSVSFKSAVNETFVLPIIPPVLEDNSRTTTSSLPPPLISKLNRDIFSPAPAPPPSSYFAKSENTSPAPPPVLPKSQPMPLSKAVKNSSATSIDIDPFLSLIPPDFSDPIEQ